MSFDTVAPFYRILERLVFGRALQRARTAMISCLRKPARALIAGEGDGRFLTRFIQEFPACDVTCVDASRTMLELARERLGAAAARVRFVCADVRGPLALEGAYDVIITHFFLDCFDATELPDVVAKLAMAARPDAQWLLADFTIPPGGSTRYMARALVPLMYGFFRVTTGISASRLIDPAPALAANGFALSTRNQFAGGMIASDVWARS
ncbi:MAG: class I SAM-dependent methyltransferase [Verrucomicrobiota bacterium]|nr:class I SAM-dependent methyltransferase [Verrucomicrobiota bacterium]